MNKKKKDKKIGKPILQQQQKPGNNQSGSRGLPINKASVARQKQQLKKHNANKKKTQTHIQTESP